MASRRPSAVDGGAHAKMLLARLIGRHQVLAAILDPFHRAAQPQRRDADQNVLRIDFAAHAEAAADMAFVQMHARWLAAEHSGERVAVPMRYLGGAVQFENAARDAGDGAARLQRYAAVAADFQIEHDDGVSAREGRVHIAKTLADQGGLGRIAGVESAGRRVGVHQRGQRLCLDCHEIGSILGDVRIGREDGSDGLTDVTHAIDGEDRLAIRIEAFDAGEAKIDRRNVGDIRRGPDRDDARNVTRRGRADRADACVGIRRTDHAHVQLMGERDVCGKAAVAGDERSIFKTRYRAADEVHRAKASRWRVSLMR